MLMSDHYHKEQTLSRTVLLPPKHSDSNIIRALEMHFSSFVSGILERKNLLLLYVIVMARSRI